MPWPSNWDDLVSGTACPMCNDGRPDETPFGIRVMEGEHLDAYLGRRAPQPGYVVAIWRGRHATDPGELSADELGDYWSEIVRVAGAMREHFRARKMNYEVLGNAVPHLHTHITARVAEGDVAPGGPLRGHPDVDLDPDRLAADAAALRALLSS
jgi:diadenosine tetraphosphate (Ap4A) HIT family hydrolase